MPNPVLLTVEDDEYTRPRLQRDLEREYGKRYRVLGTRRARSALETLRQLQCAQDQVALLVVDRQLPDMASDTFLEEAIALHPDARRVLCIEIGEIDVAMEIARRVGIDHCLTKPWEPADQFLYPIVDDLLEDWTACPRPSQEPLTVVGYRFSPECHELRDFLVRNAVPFRWLDVERDRAAHAVVLLSGVTRPRLPLVRLPDGTVLVQPRLADLAARIGLQVRPVQSVYDLVIIGAGPTGLAAAVYGASEGLRTIVVERHAPGGKAGLSAKIENYLGFPAGLSGTDLAQRAVAQARKFGVEIVAPQPFSGLRLEGPSRVVTLGDGSELRAHVVLLATGVEWRRLEAPGVDRLTGKGIYYGGTTAEAVFCANEHIFIVGGGNSAGQAALAFARYARSVTMLVRDESLSKFMSQYLIDQIATTKNVTVRLRTTVIEAHGGDHLEAITIHDAATGRTERCKTSVVFVLIGGVPNTECLSGLLQTDRNGFILTGRDLPDSGGTHGWPRAWTLDRDPFLLESSVPGVFAAGDVRHGSVKRVAAGVGEGATAIQFVHQYLSVDPTEQ